MKRFLLYLVALTTIVGCNKDFEDVATISSEVRISSSIATRVSDSQWDKKDEIGVYMTLSSDDSSLGDNIMYMTTDGDGVFTSDNPLYYPESGSVDLFAYYPYVYGVDLSSYSLNSEEAQIDLLSVTKSGVKRSSESVDLTFDHLLSKISLEIKAGDGLTTDELAGLGVELSNINTSAKFDINGKKVVDGSLDAMGSLALTTNSAGTESSAIVIPQDLSSATLYFATEDYGTFCATLSTETFAVGYEYKYTITVSRYSVDITASNINPWNGTTIITTANIVDIEYKSGKYYINSAKGLAAFRDVVNLNSYNTQNATFAGFEESAFAESNTDIDGVLTRNIDLKDICNETSSWEPIGYYNDSSDLKMNPYSGTFDGGGFKISGLYIAESSNQRGLFRYLGSDGLLYNLGVSGSVIHTATASTNHETAGLVAYNLGTIINCYSLIDVDAGYITNVGGIAAYNVGSVVNCYNQGDVKGYKNVGGIVGWNGDGGYVGYCYSTGTVTGLSEESGENRAKVGGVVGWNYATTDADPTIKGSFCLGTYGTDYSIGQTSYIASDGLYGNVCDEEYLTSEVFATIINNGACTYNKNYPDSPIAACAWVDNSSISDYPTLNFGVTGDEIEWIYDIIYNSGVYDIYTDEGLLAFAAMVNGSGAPTIAEGSVLVTSGGDHFDYDNAQLDLDGSLFEDIDLGNEEWAPIGDFENPYTGTFNGNGYLVSGLSVSGYDCAGLFGRTGSGAEISNLGVDGSVNEFYAGGVVGYNDGGTLTNCYNMGSVRSDSASNGEAGGVVGYNNNGTLTNCYNTGSVTNGRVIGGVVGTNVGGTITNCYNTAGVNSGMNVGGVVGDNDSDGTITNCYNTASVSSQYYAGGVVGSNSGAITNCYNTGNVNGSNYTGGVVGSNYGTLSNCFWEIKSSDAYSGVGNDEVDRGTEGMESDEMKVADFVTTLNNNAYTYNETDPGVAACAWIAVSDGYPTLDFSAEPTGWTADAFSSNTYPSYNTWYISDEEITDFTGIKEALATANTNGDITVVFLNLIEMPEGAFVECYNLTSISLPSAVTIGNNAFAFCTSLTSVSLPSAVTIEWAAFAYCTSLTSISLPSAVTIGVCAFGECPNLTTLDLGSSGSGITSIELDAFYNVPTSANLTIKIAEDADGVSVSGNTLTYNSSSETATFASITVV